MLSRTFHDTAASRGGMVFSHMPSWLPWTNWCRSRTCNLFCDSWPLQTDNAPTPPRCDSPARKRPLPHAIDLVDAANALAAAREPSPSYGSAITGSTISLSPLWVHLPPEIRRGFAFRLSFGPTDLVEQPMPATGMHSPCHRGDAGPEHPVIRTATPREPDSLAAAILSGRARSSPLIEFMQQMEVRPATFPRRAVGRAGLSARYRRTFIGATRRPHEANREVVAEF